MGVWRVRDKHDANRGERLTTSELNATGVWVQAITQTVANGWLPVSSREALNFWSDGGHGARTAT